MKKYFALLLCMLLLLTLAACSETKTVHCDRCGTEIVIESDSNVDEEWILLCGDCEEELHGDNPEVSPE